MPNLKRRIRAYAPACIGNFAAGFDLLGAAVAPLDGTPWGDFVEAWELPPGEEPALTVSGPHGDRMPSDPQENLVLRSYQLFRAAVQSQGATCPPLAFHLEKNLPRCSGLGSSSCSIAAALAACQHLLGEPLTQAELFLVAGRAEGFASGAIHLDNVVPCLIGGMQLIVPGPPGPPGPGATSEARALPWPADLVLVVLSPELELATAHSRGVLPTSWPLAESLAFAQNLAGFVQAVATDDRELLRRCLRDVLTEPYRAPLVPGFRAAQAAALASGALGCGLSGSGPASFAVAESVAQGEAIAAAMTEALAAQGIAARARLCGLDTQGARVVAS